MNENETNICMKKYINIQLRTITEYGMQNFPENPVMFNEVLLSLISDVFAITMSKFGLSEHEIKEVLLEITNDSLSHVRFRNKLNMDT